MTDQTPPSLGEEAPINPYRSPAPSNPGPSGGLAITALIVGIVAFLSGLAPFWGLIAGAAAVALGAVALAKKQNKGLAVAGLILGAVAALTSLITTVILIGGVNAIRDNDSALPKPSETTVAEETSVPEETPTPEPPTVFETQTFTGVGDFVQPVNVADVVIVGFSCADCTSNTVLISNGAESLLVNTIGPYSGTHWINLNINSMTTEFEIKADGNWTLTLSDPTTAAIFDGAATGTGDSAIYIRANSTTAAITNDAGGNFVVVGYGGSYSELAVNEIGAYSGTVKLTMPAVIQVNSEGNWSITPQ